MRVGTAGVVVLLGTVGSVFGSVGPELVEAPQAPWLRSVSVGASSMAPPTQSCPADMVDMAGYCIDRHPTRTFVNWYEAADQCQAQGKRLCTNAEWLEACDAAPINGVEEMPNRQSEWLSNWVFEPAEDVFDALERGYFRCRTTSHPWPAYRPYQIKWFRCCVDGEPDCDPKGSDAVPHSR